MTRVIGIDPGVTGALALLADSGAAVWDLPAAISASTNTVSAHDLRDRLVAIGPVDAAFIEEVHANAMSYKGNFTLGLATGIILGVCAALELPIHRIKPKDWQKAMGLSGISPGERKAAHRMRATEMWPALSGDLKRVKDHGRADALLIAEAGRRIL